MRFHFFLVVLCLQQTVLKYYVCVCVHNIPIICTFTLYGVNSNDTRIPEDILVVSQLAQFYYLQLARVSYCYLYKVTSIHMKSFNIITGLGCCSYGDTFCPYLHYLRGRSSTISKLSQRVTIEAKIPGSVPEVM